MKKSQRVTSEVNTIDRSQQLSLDRASPSPSLLVHLAEDETNSENPPPLKLKSTSSSIIENSSSTASSSSPVPPAAETPSVIPCPMIMCRVHTTKQLKYICLDQFCDYQRMICEDCEQTEHYQRHQHRCILFNELYAKQDQKFSLSNWPQDSYLRIFQDYLKSQSSDYDSRVKDMCEKLLAFLTSKVEEVQTILAKISDEEKQRNADSNLSLETSYLNSCASLDSLRKIIDNLDAKLVKSTALKNAETKQKLLFVETERAITSQLKEFITKANKYKTYLNEKFGFGYFQSQQKEPSIINFSLIEKEFTDLKAHVTETTTFIAKNAYLPESFKTPRQSRQYEEEEGGSSAIENNPADPTANGRDNNGAGNEGNEEKSGQRLKCEEYHFHYGLKFSTAITELNHIGFNPEYKQILLTNLDQRAGSSSTFFYSNLLPQQSIFQLRVTGEITCGMYLGVIDDDSKAIAIRTKELSDRFVGACLGCEYEVYGKCKTQGPGLDFKGEENNAAKGRHLHFGENDGDEERDDEVNEEDEDEVKEGSEMRSFIVEVFINLTKKMITITDSSKQHYIKFDLDNRNYIYNRNLRLFVQSNRDLRVEVLHYNWVK